MRPRPNMLRLRPQRMLAAAVAASAERQILLAGLQISPRSTPHSSLRGSGYMSSWSRNSRTRPQLPFLLVPSSSSSRSGTPNRYFTTQRRRWLGYEALAFAKYTLYFWAAVSCFLLGQFVIQQEWMEREHPTPSDWSFMSRMRLRGALGEGRLPSDGDGDGSDAEDASASAADDQSMSDAATYLVDHVKIIQILLDLIARLEDPAIDGGAGLTGVLDTSNIDGPSVLAADSQAMDIRAKSEPWRRGYYEALLAAAATAEHVDGWVRDRTRNLVCPADVVIGPSNPNPRPLPPGASGAPREEDCDPCFPLPAELYLKLLHTRGLTPRQQITAALAFANYLEFKQDNDAAAYVYGQAVLVARAPPSDSESGAVYGKTFFESTSEAGDGKVDATGWVKNWMEAQSRSSNNSAPPVSRNLIKTLTAYATFKARSGDVAGALPLFIALLQARRAIPPSAPTQSTHASKSSRGKPEGIVDQILALLAPPAYPPPPDDGYSPPPSGARSICEEAALRLHIGEILYASARKGPASKSSWALFSSGTQQHHAREEGIAWTREAVDMAEEQLHALTRKNVSKEKDMHKRGGVSSALKQLVNPISSEGKATCRDCLVTGIDNWAIMVAQLARDEQKEAAAKAGATQTSASVSSESSWWPSWLSLWGSGSSAGDMSTHSSAEAKLGRWAAEERVIQERRRRVRDLLDDAAPASHGIMAMLKA
ncbi:hypothetical protein F503_01155 [Ophiostoma piceae UAMH 11346]|uniref:Mfs maltose permease n=1 Tax=Ophiostoma piceae (strain UAMH 11346) TaxID=1262450 RepID=S3C6E7_OPHP1|nr:hypothetical protein F503_01155 [Ophiostoma piceae UAMH 11346]